MGGVRDAPPPEGDQEVWHRHRLREADGHHGEGERQDRGVSRRPSTRGLDIISTNHLQPIYSVSEGGCEVKRTTYNCTGPRGRFFCSFGGRRSERDDISVRTVL